MELEADKSNTSSAIFCRICHDEGDLVSPCNCTGTVGLVHIMCLEKWLSTDRGPSCELCGFEFALTVRQKTLVEWLKSLKRESDQRRYILCDIMSFVLLTPLLIFAFVMCILGRFHYLETEALSEANSLLILGLLIVLVYIIWIYLLLSHNWSEFKHWRKDNRDVKILTIKEEMV